MGRVLRICCEERPSPYPCRDVREANIAIEDAWWAECKQVLERNKRRRPRLPFDAQKTAKLLRVLIEFGHRPGNDVWPPFPDVLSTRTVCHAPEQHRQFIKYFRDNVCEFLIRYWSQTMDWWVYSDFIHPDFGPQFAPYRLRCHDLICDGIDAAFLRYVLETRARGDVLVAPIRGGTGGQNGDRVEPVAPTRKSTRCGNDKPLAPARSSTRIDESSFGNVDGPEF